MSYIHDNNIDIKLYEYERETSNVELKKIHVCVKKTH